MHETLRAAAALLILAAATPGVARPLTTQPQLVGTWKVVSLKVTSGGSVSRPLGEHPGGYLSFTPSRLWLLFVDPARGLPAASAYTDAEAGAAMKTHVSWTGRYTATGQTPDGLKVVAHVDTASSETLNGADRTYFMRIDGATLIVKSAPLIVPMTGALSSVEIELVRAD